MLVFPYFPAGGYTISCYSYLKYIGKRVHA